MVRSIDTGFLDDRVGESRVAALGLGGEDIEPSADALVLDGLGHCRFVHHASPTGVDEDGARLHGIAELRPNQMHGLGDRCDVNRNDIGHPCEVEQVFAVSNSHRICL